MSKLKNIFKSFPEGDKNIRIIDSHYKKLLEESNGDEEGVEILINQILDKRFNQLERETQKKINNIKHEEELLSYYKFLDKYLFATLGNNIKIGITNLLVGKETSQCNFVLNDYELSQKYMYLILRLERNGELFPIQFSDITDIKFNDNGNSLKTWIYMPNNTWRFYLNYDQSKLSDEESSEKLILSDA